MVKREKGMASANSLKIAAVSAEKGLANLRWFTQWWKKTVEKLVGRVFLLLKWGDLQYDIEANFFPVVFHVFLQLNMGMYSFLKHDVYLG